jgi:hypothetical protein
MPVDEAPDDDDGGVRQSYNFAPGYHGLVYRADGPQQHGNSNAPADKPEDQHREKDEDLQADETDNKAEKVAVSIQGHKHTKYKLQSMRWGKLAPRLGSTDRPTDRRLRRENHVVLTLDTT